MALSDDDLARIREEEEYRALVRREIRSRAVREPLAAASARVNELADWRRVSKGVLILLGFAIVAAIVAWAMNKYHLMPRGAGWVVAPIAILGAAAKLIWDGFRNPTRSDRGNTATPESGGGRASTLPSPAVRDIDAQLMLGRSVVVLVGRSEPNPQLLSAFMAAKSKFGHAVTFTQIHDDAGELDERLRSGTRPIMALLRKRRVVRVWTSSIPADVCGRQLASCLSCDV